MTFPDSLKNPWVLGTGVFIIGLVWFISRRTGSGSASTSVYSPASDGGYGSQLQFANRQLDLQYQASVNQTDAALEIAKLSVQDNMDYRSQMLLMNRDDNATQAQIAFAQIAGSIELQAGMNATSIQLAQIQGATDLGISNNELKAALSADATDLAKSKLSAETATELATIQANSAKDLAVISAQNAIDLNTLYKDSQYDLANLAAYRDITLNQQAVDAATTINAQNNATAQLAIETQGNVYRDAIGAQADVEKTYIQTVGGIVSQQIDARSKIEQSIAQQIGYGNFNKGGEGGTNQVAVTSALLGQPSVGVAAMQAQAIDEANNSIGGILRGFASIVNAGANVAYATQP